MSFQLSAINNYALSQQTKLAQNNPTSFGNTQLLLTQTSSAVKKMLPVVKKLTFGDKFKAFVNKLITFIRQILAKIFKIGQNNNVRKSMQTQLANANTRFTIVA